MERMVIPSPEEFFGFKMGADLKLARWDKIVDYFQLLAKNSDKIRVTELGKTVEGNPFLLAIITSARNMNNLERIRKISLRLAYSGRLSEVEANSLVKNGKAVVAITNSLHATEVGALRWCLSSLTPFSQAILLKSSTYSTRWFFSLFPVPILMVTSWLLIGTTSGWELSMRALLLLGSTRSILAMTITETSLC